MPDATAGLCRWNVLATRYNRAACILLLIPKSVFGEVQKPDGAHAVTLAVAIMLGALDGLLYRISVARWEARDA